ncbi:hypothetical protein [Stappia indica]|uniref:Uncharacterized protein n=1 Tax=Stappia indica TaxID=538381 RepID=A0A857C4Z8_9HYPH|nr:hypothetical protein [Stappia indica]QGZ33958.1 hypothetical protein GH266_05180 [Stappia indica]
MRFDMRAVGGAGGVYILDRWTGEVRHCQFDLCTPTEDATFAKKTPPNIFDKFDGEPVLENAR